MSCFFGTPIAFVQGNFEQLFFEYLNIFENHYQIF